MSSSKDTIKKKRKQRQAKRLAKKLAMHDRPQYPESYEAVREFLLSVGLNEGLAKPHLRTPPQYVPKVIESFKRPRPRAIGHGVDPTLSRKARRNQLEAQRYRCAYDLYEMNLEDPLSPRYATVEHVVPLSDGGSTSRMNTVMACKVCNALRSKHSDKDAYEFHDWAMANRDEIEKLAQHQLKGIEHKIRIKRTRRLPLVDMFR